MNDFVNQLDTDQEIHLNTHTHTHSRANIVNKNRRCFINYRSCYISCEWMGNRCVIYHRCVVLFGKTRMGCAYLDGVAHVVNIISLQMCNMHTAHNSYLACGVLRRCVCIQCTRLVFPNARSRFKCTVSTTFAELFVYHIIPTYVGSQLLSCHTIYNREIRWCASVARCRLSNAKVE